MPQPAPNRTRTANSGQSAKQEPETTDHTRRERPRQNNERDQAVDESGVLPVVDSFRAHEPSFAKKIRLRSLFMIDNHGFARICCPAAKNAWGIRGLGNPLRNPMGAAADHASPDRKDFSEDKAYVQSFSERQVAYVFS
jgi:hypothetical protein